MSTEHGSKIKFKVRYVASCTTAKVMKHQIRRGKTPGGYIYVLYRYVPL